MKIAAWCALLLFCGCSSETDSGLAPTDADLIQKRIRSYYADLSTAYNSGTVNTDSLIDAYFDRDVYYVTYWGTAEPIDTTKTRFRSAMQVLKEYDYSIENLTVKSYGTGAYAFFVLRQSYTLDGQLMDEYLPTTWVWEKKSGVWKVVHAQRCADLPTIQQLMAVASRRQAEEQQQVRQE